MNSVFPQSALALALLSSAAHAQEASPASGKPHFLSVKPVLIDAANSDGLVLGLDYELRKNYSKKVLSGDSGKPDFNPEATRTDIAFELKGKGTIASDKKKNPNKLVDIGASYSYMWRGGPAYAAFGAQAKLETDQSLDNRQYAFGALGTATYYFQNGSFLGADLGFARVNPATDAARKAALGASPLDSFQRWEAEVFYKYPFGGVIEFISDIEFNYRFFKEVSPPLAVKAAGLDEYRLSLVRLNMKDNLFLQYSHGKLPFDTKKERVVKIGWDYKIK